eukprot:g4797.t1
MSVLAALARGAAAVQDPWRKTLLGGHEEVLAASSSLIPEEDEKFLANYLSRSAEEIRNDRAGRLKSFIEMARSCRPKSTRGWAKSGHLGEISGHLNYILLKKLVEKHGYADAGIVDDIRNGFPLIGSTPDAGIFPANDRAVAAPSLGDVFSPEIKTKKPAWMGDKLIEEAWKTAREEIATGRIVEIEVEELRALAEAEQIFINYSFAIDQSTDDAEKFRTVVHYKEVNKLASISEKIQLPTHRKLVAWMAYLLSGGKDFSSLLESKAEVFAALQRATECRAAEVEKEEKPPAQKLAREDFAPAFWDAFAEVGHRPEDAQHSSRVAGATEHHAPATTASSTNRKRPANSSSSSAKRPARADTPTVPGGFTTLARDFKGAYKQMACKDLGHNITATWDPDPKNPRWRFFKCKYMGFGSLWAVSAWVRISMLCRFILKEELGILTSIYIDDLLAIEKDELADQAEEILTAFFRATGFRESENKRERGKKLRVLGVFYDISGREVVCDLPLGKRQDLDEALAKCLRAARAGSLRVQGLQSVAGKVNFLLVATKYTALAAALSPLYSGIAGIDDKTAVVPGCSELAPALEHLRKLVAVAPPFRLNCDEDPNDRAVLWTDAADDEVSSSICFVLRVGDRVYCAARPLPEGVRSVFKQRKEKIINLVETLAVLWALEAVAPVIRGKKLVLFIDNSAALFSILKGTSSDILSRILAQAVRCSALQLGVLWTLRYVSSEDNPADGGTRPELFERLAKVIGESGLTCSVLKFPPSPSVVAAVAEIVARTSAVRQTGSK